MSNYSLSHLDHLESEAIFILRETAAQFENPVLLFSGGKDSIVMAHLAYKAFAPSKIPFVLMHVDTGHNFPETMVFRDEFVAKIGARLVVASVQKSIDDGRVTEEKGVNASRNGLQTVALLDGIEEHQFDAALGGGRRDSLMRHSVAVAETRKKHEPKSASFPTVMILANGTLRTNALNFGIYLMAASTMASTSGSSHSPIGRKWISGSISKKRTSICPIFISLMKERCSSVMVRCWR